MKRVINKLIILFLVFASTLALYFLFSYNKADSSTITMGKATLPVVRVNQGEDKINLMYGYTMEMEPQYMRDSITPVPADNMVKLTVDNCENVITGVKCEVRSLDSQKVFESVDIKDFSSTKDSTEISYQVGKVITPDQEYILVVTLSTDRYEKVYYYTRIEQISDPHYADQDTFVHYFSDTTFDKSKAEELVSYIEPSTSEENTNLGKVNIHSNFNQLKWGNMNPEKVGRTQMTYKELLGDVGSFVLEYKIKAKNDFDTYQYYNIREYYRIKWTSTQIYLLDYERTMNQVFDATGQSVTSSRVNLGIDSSLDCDYMTDDDGGYIAFVKEQSLWLMDTNTNQITSVFSFANSAEDEDFRNVNEEHDIKLVEVDKKGNVKFLVYGYMNRGEHEGKVGVTLYQFNKKTNIVDESIFIPFTRSFEILKETMGKLLYVNNSDVMFIMLNDCIYSIDLTGNEYVQIISNLKDGCYAINSDNDIIAWEKDMSGSGSSGIEVMNLKTNQEYTINADPGTKIKVIGFVDRDIAYGIADEDKIVTDQNGVTTVPMRLLKIVNMKGKEQKSYSQEGFFFTSALVKDNMINLKRAVYAPDGVNLQTTSDYQVFGNAEENEAAATLTQITTELKETELVIKFASKIITSDKLEVRYPKEIKFDETNALSLRDLISSKGCYYVYGYGRITSITDNPAGAIVRADESNGVVVDDNGKCIWARRSRDTAVSMNDISVVPSPGGSVTACVNAMLSKNGAAQDVSGEIAQGKSTIEIINSHLNDGKALDLAGCNLDEVIYYVNKGQPVLGMTDSGNCLLVVGFDFYNAVLINPLTGQMYKQGLEETSNQFAQYGNRFVGIDK